MLCEKCNQRPAAIHTVSILNGLAFEHYLCAECANGMKIGIPSLMEILSGVQHTKRQEALPACECGMSFSEFQQTGLLGCQKCYGTFQAALAPVIKRAQGGRLRHVGRRPEGAIANNDEAPVQEQAAQEIQTLETERTRLQSELCAAVKEERYERAAELRDRLRAMEGGLPA